jgi:hypothetical protein
LAPVDEAPDAIDGLSGFVFALQAIEEGGFGVGSNSLGGKCFVVDLIADDCRVVFKGRDDLADDALRGGGSRD